VIKTLPKYLLIDDMRDIRADVICRRPDDGIKALIGMGPFDILYLDHDMGIENGFIDPLIASIAGALDNYETPPMIEYSGYGVACFIENHPEYAPDCVEIVSDNHGGVKRIAGALQNVYAFSKNGRTFSKHDLNLKLFS
jgi:hypothetical protein